MAYLAPQQLATFEEAERRRHPAIFGEAPSSELLGPQRQEFMYLRELVESSRGSQYVGLEQAYFELRDQLTLLNGVGENWDTYNAPAPSPDSIGAAGRALDILRGLNAQPSGIVPSAEGGVGICFIRGQAYAHIEFLNDSSVYGMMYAPGKGPQNWQLGAASADSIQETWNRIRAYLQP